MAGSFLGANLRPPLALRAGRRWASSLLVCLLVGCASAPETVPRTAPVLAMAYRFGDQERTAQGGLQPEVVLWTDAYGREPLDVLGIVDDSLYYGRGWNLYRRHLDNDAVEKISSHSANVTAIATDGAELFWTTADCQVSSRRSPYLGGECLASPQYLFVDARHLYLFARKARTWRHPVMTLWKMPRSGGKARQVAELEDFGSISGRVEPLFDGNAFYYVDLYGHVLRLRKDDTKPERFGEVPTLQSVRLEFTDADAVYWTSSRGLVRAPKDGGRQTVIAEGSGSYAKAGAVLYQATQDAIYRAAPSGRWERIVELPSSGSLSSWRLWAVRGRLYAYDYKVLLRMDPGGPRAFRVLELEQGDDVGIKSLALGGNELFYTTGGNFETSFDEPEGSRGMSVWSMPKRGGTPRLLFDQVHLAAAPVFDTGAVRYLTKDGTLYRRSLSDLRPAQLSSRAELAAASDHAQSEIVRAGRSPACVGIDVRIRHAAQSGGRRRSRRVLDRSGARCSRQAPQGRRRGHHHRRRPEAGHRARPRSAPCLPRDAR